VARSTPRLGLVARIVIVAKNHISNLIRMIFGIK
jgi:hypothetical protein